MVELVEGRGACGCACGKGLGTRALWRAKAVAVGSGGHISALWLILGTPAAAGEARVWSSGENMSQCVCSF